jgi:hypothetical protein
MECKIVNFSHSEFHRCLCGRTYGVHGNLYFSTYTLLVLLRISVAESQNCLTAFGGSVPCRISAVSVKWFVGYIEKSAYGLT